MNIALMNEFSQASKNPIVLAQLKDVVEPMGHTVYNTGMTGDDDPCYLTYLNLGVQAALLINSKAADFVIAGCGTGQGALMALNSFPGVVCGYCIEPTDAYLFLQINDGNALSIPFAKGFGWGAELNIHTMFEKAFGSPKGMGYPADRRESQNRNAATLFKVKSETCKPLLEGLKAMDEEIVKKSLTPRFLECFYANCKDAEIEAYVKSIADAK
ncbi:MAG: hypothetical protein EOM64_01135 [Erysipelotrichia bacterium]|nr:hypothetical protein [Erysipelotrichia bacterium]